MTLLGHADAGAGCLWSARAPDPWSRGYMASSQTYKNSHSENWQAILGHVISMGLPLLQCLHLLSNTVD